MEYEDRKYLEKILTILSVPQPEAVVKMFLFDGTTFLMLQKSMKKATNNSVQIGGKHHDIKYDGHTYRIFESYDKYSKSIAIKRDGDIDNPQSCILIFIDNDSSVAYIHNISYYPNCAKPALDYPGGGSALLKFSLHLLRKNRDRYEVSRIQLKDNSRMLCGDGKYVQLPLTITT